MTCERYDGAMLRSLYEEQRRKLSSIQKYSVKQERDKLEAEIDRLLQLLLSSEQMGPERY